MFHHVVSVFLRLFTGEKTLGKIRHAAKKFNISRVEQDALSNENAIARAVRNIVSTTPGEKFFDPDFGSSIGEILFENVDEITAISIQDEIRNCLNNYEPRVEIIEVNVKKFPLIKILSLIPDKNSLFDIVENL